MTDTSVDNPFFARMWIAMSSRERKFMTRLRQENLAGLRGRVLEIGAGTGTNFAFYPDTVTEVVAVEPEVRLAPLARKAALTAPVAEATSAGVAHGGLSTVTAAKSIAP